MTAIDILGMIHENRASEADCRDAGRRLHDGRLRRNRQRERSPEDRSNGPGRRTTVRQAKADAQAEADTPADATPDTARDSTPNASADTSADPTAHPAADIHARAGRHGNAKHRPGCRHHDRRQRGASGREPWWHTRSPGDPALAHRRGGRR
jgi:hypothetical protein